jgi:hypothetical protein
MSQFDTENKDLLLATALASGSSASTAARQMDLSLSTVKRRMADPEFCRLISDLRGEMLSAALGRMTDNLTRAADTFAGLLDAEDPGVRLRAARALFTVGLRLRDAIDVTERIRVLEGEFANQQAIAP